jgi:hypothetical protein
MIMSMMGKKDDDGDDDKQDNTRTMQTQSFTAGQQSNALSRVGEFSAGRS